MFNYQKGPLASGGGGGLAYFLAVQCSLIIAQVVNFISQRNVTFESKGSLGKHITWYAIAFVLITVFGAAAQGLYKAPIYTLLIDTWNMGMTGETLADVISVIITCAISFWVYFPIMKLIFHK
jgi:putative flippase GtrA